MLTPLVYSHIPMRQTKIKLNTKGRVYGLHFPTPYTKEEYQSENLEAKIEVMIMEEYDLLACSPGLPQPAFLFNSVTFPIGGSALSGLGLSTSVCNHENVPPNLHGDSSV